MALRPISRVDDYTFPADAWDVRGWTVRTELDDEKVGQVDDMLLDHNGALRYLDVDLGSRKRHVLVPLDAAYADRHSETVRLEGLGRTHLDRIPDYGLEPESLDESYERRLARAWGGESARRLESRRDEEAHRDPDEQIELRRMSMLEENYRVSGQDPRGWDLVTADGEKAGKVSELLMDPAAMTARFLDVAVDEKALDLEPVERHILLPADRVRMEAGKKRVVVGGLLAGDLSHYPQYGGLPLRQGQVDEMERFFDRAGEAPADDDRYREEREGRGPSQRNFFRSGERSRGDRHEDDLRDDDRSRRPIADERSDERSRLRTTDDPHRSERDFHG
jgi:photosynthetic reaction center H subunit